MGDGVVVTEAVGAAVVGSVVVVVAGVVDVVVVVIVVVGCGLGVAVGALVVGALVVGCRVGADVGVAVVPPTMAGSSSVPTLLFIASKHGHHGSYTTMPSGVSNSVTSSPLHSSAYNSLH